MPLPVFNKINEFSTFIAIDKLDGASVEARALMNQPIYVLYRGDEIVGMGSKAELAKKLNV